MSEPRRPRFRTSHTRPPAAASPEDLFSDLPRTRSGHGALWSHQADMLRAFHADHVSTPDVALELPTGSGKTLVGLLIGEWKRLRFEHRVVYACPTRQLARQAHQVARDHGIRSVCLVGRNIHWDERDRARYESADAIAVTTYSHVFNTNSAFPDAHTVIFDDAHAAENYVADAWSLTVSAPHPVFSHVIDILGKGLDQHHLSRMLTPTGARRAEASLLPISLVHRSAVQLDLALSTLTGSQQFDFQMLRPGLSSCLFYLAPGELYIRPMIPPTFQHHPFTEPQQRVYLSATLGEAGELERSFGRAPIVRIPAPPGWERTGSGRRFFVFADLADLGDMSSMTALRHLTQLEPKRMILTPDAASANALADGLGIPDEERYTAQSEQGLTPFAAVDKGTLLAPSRYDGMDLAGNTCRILVLSGLPQAMHLQDRFLAMRLNAGDVLLARTTSRVIQGAGRCTRGPKDYSLVIVHGGDLTRYLSRSEVRAALPVDLQAELHFGLDNSREMPVADLAWLAGSSLRRDQDWQQQAEPEIAQLRHTKSQTLPPFMADLAASVEVEIAAWTAAWRRDWTEASIKAAAISGMFSGVKVQPYQALWAYFGSEWAKLAAAEGDPYAGQRALELWERARMYSISAVWLRDLSAADDTARVYEQVDRDAADSVSVLLRSTYASPAHLASELSALADGLGQTEAKQYEQALVILGTLLGAQSHKPTGPGRTDAAWVWPQLWITIEAKSEQKPEGHINLDLVRQANAQLTSLSSDRGETPPPGSFSILMSPRTQLFPEAVAGAQAHLFHLTPEVFVALALDTAEAWKELHPASTGVTGDDLAGMVARIFDQHRVLPTQIRDRLTVSPIN